MQRLRGWLGVILACGSATGAAAQDAAKVTVQGGGCARTLAGAIELAKGVPGALLLSQKDGFRVRSVRWDAAQRQSWAVIESCQHPELPSVAILTDLPPDKSAAGTVSAEIASVLTNSAAIIRTNAAVAIVKAGDVVRLWKSEANARIELIATAEENGSVGSRVRVRLAARRETDGQTAPPQFLAGVVRGPADVEIEP